MSRISSLKVSLCLCAVLPCGGKATVALAGDTDIGPHTAIVEADMDMNARLGDEVKEGQLLFKIRSADVAGVYSDYRKAIKNDRQAL